MKQPSYVSHYLKQFKPKINQIPIDQQTKNILTNILRKRLQRDQLPQLSDLTHLINASTLLSNSNPTTKYIPKILKLCYKQARYTDSKDLQWFLKAKLDVWPSESQSVYLENERNSLNFKAKNSQELKTIAFPDINTDEERFLPSILELIQDLPSSNKSLDFSIDPIFNVFESETSQQNHNQRILTSVLTLYNSIRTNATVSHPRSLQSPIAMIPLTPLGVPVAKVRHKNIIRKKIRYIRQILLEIPPLDKVDFLHLESILDQWYDEQKKDETKSKVIKHYEQFLQRNYYLGDDLTCQVSKKYSYVRTEGTVSDQRYFTKIIIDPLKIG